jgi:hypothetical protein
MCSGSVAQATVTCTNTGGTTWDGSLQLAVSPPGHDSFFADTSWLSPQIVTTVQPASVAPMQTGTFSFVLHAPEVIGPIDYHLRWALQPAGGMPYASPSPDSMAMDVMVHPCAPVMDGGVGSDAGVRGDAGRDGGVGVTDAGCGCGVAPGAALARRWAALAIAAVAMASRARRRTKRRDGSDRRR